MKLKLRLIILLFLLSIKWVNAQNSSIQIGTQIPLMYSLGYEYKASDKISFNAQAGILTKPYDVAILYMLEAFGTDDAIIFAIKKSFNYGVIFQPTVKYHLSDNYYLGLTYSYYSLYSNNFEYNSGSSSGFSFPFLSNLTLLKLRSNLSNAGITAGREFNLKAQDLKLSLEVSLQKTFYSKSTLYSDTGNISSLSAKVDYELNKYYIQYGYLPSINVFISKSF